ncbi:hypothetical protein Rsub_06660 [Raphidocelis subcapitata]|uniref:Uncharacterized protein n=1 Tax=Raphidocelis subcapitata TaxID=307507 RepID=A0A2V0P8P6_9CHLO|nr:hypothetical protein Rsub_06660 [Raphidocelis subcapitata]|eukprot:GBF93527.1 hypothetical protein Rsub_06660 [Raphidocelis subcapitata]
MGGSYHNLAALAEAQFSDARQADAAAHHRGDGGGGGGGGGGDSDSDGGGGGGGGGAPLAAAAQTGSGLSLDSQGGRAKWVQAGAAAGRLIIVSNVLPVRQRRDGADWVFELDEDSLVAQAKEGIPDEYEVVYVGCTPSDVDIMEQEQSFIQDSPQFNPPKGYEPVHYVERHVPLHERIAFLAAADAAVVTATRDGMNLVPYEYVVCRQGPDSNPAARESMLVVSGAH